MRLNYTSHTGHYNLCDPSQVSTSCTIRIYDDEGKIIRYVSVSVEGEEDGDDVDRAIELIEEEDKRCFFSTARESWKEMIAFLKEHQDEIEAGNRKYEIENLTKKIGALQKRLDFLQSHS